jgi:hypothetical protein
MPIIFFFEWISIQKLSNSNGPRFNMYINIIDYKKFTQKFHPQLHNLSFEVYMYLTLW